MILISVVVFIIKKVYSFNNTFMSNSSDWVFIESPKYTTPLWNVMYNCTIVECIENMKN